MLSNKGDTKKMNHQFVRFTLIAEVEIDNVEELQSCGRVMEEASNCIDSLCDMVVRIKEEKVELIEGTIEIRKDD
jgi:hypothetical protein